MLSYSMPVIRLRASGRIRPFLGRSLKKILTSSNLSASSQRILSPEGAVWGGLPVDPLEIPERNGEEPVSAIPPIRT